MNDNPVMKLGIAEVIGDKRDEILRLAAQYGAYNVRIFGSVARGEAHSNSDVDFLVEFREGSTIWDAVGLWRNLSGILGREVSVIAEESSEDSFMQSALKDAVRL
jgi:hypothetical protein